MIKKLKYDFIDLHDKRYVDIIEYLQPFDGPARLQAEQAQEQHRVATHFTFILLLLTQVSRVLQPFWSGSPAQLAVWRYRFAAATTASPPSTTTTTHTEADNPTTPIRFPPPSPLVLKSMEIDLSNEKFQFFSTGRPTHE